MKRIYLACPYSHPDKKVREKRVRQATKVAAKLMDRGYRVFSPITHTHNISKYTKHDPCDNNFWMNQDMWILVISEEVWVLCLEGWNKSKGVAHEMEIAKELNIKINFLEDDYG